MKSIVAFALIAGCGFPQPANNSTDAGGDAPPGPPCPTCQLVAIEPSLANTGDTITLEGTFGDAATVNFPGGASASATILGPHRATAIVPGTATTGALTVSVGSTTVGPVPFRRASFALGLQSFTSFDVQTAGGRQTTTLVTARAYHAGVVVGSSLYVMGGIGPGNVALASVERSLINADGSLGSFATVSGVTLVTPRYLSQAVVIGDFVYEIGGATTPVDTPLASVERAPILTDGSLGPFAIVPGVTLAKPRFGHTVAVVGNSLYVIGGRTPALDPTIERAQIDPDGTLEPFATVPGVTLAVPRVLLTSVVIGPFVYVLGGDDSISTTSTQVERALINADGSLGAFAIVSATTMTTARDRFTALAVGPSLYLVGGFNPNSTELTTIERAPINGDGSLGAFAAVSGTLPAARAGYSITVVGNLAHLVGGVGLDQNPVNAVAHAAINNSDTLGAMATGSATLVTARHSHTSAVVGSYLYMIGGDMLGGDVNAGGLRSVERAPLAADGSLGVFATVSGVSLSTPRTHHTSAVIGDFVYVIGGWDDNNDALNSLERAPINSDGSLGAFATVSGVLVTPRATHASAVVGSSLYVFGGFTGNVGTGMYLNSVERATINPDGSLGPFATVSGVTLTVARQFHAMAIVGTSLYVIGGYTPSGGVQKTIERATINPDGSIGTFATASGIALVDGRYSHTNVILGSELYVIGGHDKTGVPSSVERATINADGSLGTFATVAAASLATPRQWHTTAMVGNFLYVLEGDNDGATPVNNVEQAGLQ